MNGLFTIAQTAGAIPEGTLPTRAHGLYTKADKKKNSLKSGWKQFSPDELKLIFNPANLLALEKPCDFWLPLLGLFTGGRISELYQLKVTDIYQIDGIWCIDITDEGDGQTVKAVAGVRKIPVHPMPLEIGLLDYLEDAQTYGGSIFPYMNADAFGHYGKTPGRRFGEYLDRLKIDNRLKVFHSFRSTSNNCLKQNGVPEEVRCQFVGHEYDTVNSTTYGSDLGPKFLLEHAANKLDFPFLNLKELRFPRTKQATRLAEEMVHARKFRARKKLKAGRASQFK